MKQSKKFSMIITILLGILALAGCNSTPVIDVDLDFEMQAGTDADKETENLIPESIGYISENEALKVESYINEFIDLSDSTEVEGYEWMQYGNKQVLHVKIQYTDKPANNYQHKEDYFFFTTWDAPVDVSYEDKGIHVGTEDECLNNHCLGEGCDFDAHFEDVTFDGQMDLLISVGNSRHAEYYCVYVYENGAFRFEKTFEHIPSYVVDKDQELIYGFDTDGVELNYETVYEYKNGEFVLIEENIENIEER